MTLDNLKNVAVAFFGLTGSLDAKYGEGLALDPKIAADYTIKNVIEPNNADVFIHTWSQGQEKVLAGLYKPKSLLVQPLPEREWKSAILRAPLRWWLRVGLKGVSRGSRGVLGEYKAAKICFFRYTSTKRVLNSIVDFARENRLRYKYVILTRLDLAHLTEFLITGPDRGGIEVSNWNEAFWSNGEVKYTTDNVLTDTGFADQWFVVNFHDIDYVAQAIDSYFDYDPSQHRLMFEHLARKNFSPTYKRFRGKDYELVRIFRYDSRV